MERDRAEIAGRDPVCLYLETTNRCNLPCTTCPRTFEELEPAANMSWDLFRSIVDQYPKIARVVLHGVGEPLMVPIRQTSESQAVPQAMSYSAVL